MRKYAAATALAIALNITMLALTASASAGPPQCNQYIGWYDYGGTKFCYRKCRIELWNTAELWDGTQNCVKRPLLQAYTAKCDTAKIAAEH
jgi:hypothetical protein